MNNFWQKKNNKSPKIDHSILGKEGEKKYPTFAMWSTQGQQPQDWELS